MEEILHQLVYGLSPHNLIIYNLSYIYKLTVANWCRISSIHSISKPLDPPRANQNIVLSWGLFLKPHGSKILILMEKKHVQVSLMTLDRTF